MKTLVWMVFLGMVSGLMGQEVEKLREERDKLIKRGMWRDAVNFYQDKLLPMSDESSGSDLERATESLGRLNAWNEFDGLVERAIAAHPQNAMLLTSAAAVYGRAPHGGQIIAGEFKRGNVTWYRGRGRDFVDPNQAPNAEAGRSVDTEYRDHVRALQLLRQATTVPGSKAESVLAWREMASRLMAMDAWKLQTLTPLATLPEWDEPGPEGGTEGAPWKGEGPVLYEPPASWDAAKNDGERWRFALAEQVRISEDADTAPMIISQHAAFSRQQFGTETLANWWGQQDPDQAKGMLETETLAEDETLAQTSDGVRRFKLPPEHHYIALYRSILDNKLVGGSAGDALTQIFLNRRQYDKAHEVLEQTIAKHGDNNDQSRAKLLKQITGNWGRFEAVEPVPTGTHPKLPIEFRNATSIKFSAAPVDMEAVLKDTMEFLKSNPRNLEWDRVNPSQIAGRLIRNGMEKFVGAPAATWEAKLTPREKHRDTHADLEMPLDRAGAWWVTAELANGNTFHTLVWIVDSVMVQHDVDGQIQWWVADAATGAPVAGAEIEFFGYRVVQKDRTKPLERNMDIQVKSFTRTTDGDAKTLLKNGDWDDNFQWMAIARSKGRASAFFGFQNFYAQSPAYENGNRDITYGITDRPLYKPGDTVHAKFYLRNVGYFEPDENRYANKTGKLVVTNGRGEEAIKVENLKTDAMGSVETEFVIPKDAPLGGWNASFVYKEEGIAAVGFQVEEYRKPEYEVKVEAPSEPVKLGDKFTATVKANYFHGAPVRNANVEIIVKRSSLGERWFPVWRWDWLYGRGAWWNGSMATWHPGWSVWGCIPPDPPWWRGNRWTPDELVMKSNVPIGQDGTARIEIDTAPAKALHGDLDARYSIEARVVDASRREERGTGSVIAARKPFEIVVWTDRGYCRAGDPVNATISAATLAGKPVVGAKGTLKMLHLTTAADGKIVETEVRSFDVTTDKDGEIHHQFAAPETGQYRLAAKLSMNGAEPAKGATILNVHGPGKDDPKDWHFGPLELIADKAEHAPGETMKLRVNSDRENADVWLFLHIAGGAGREAKRVQLQGKSLEVDVPLDLRDMPNMFIEGVTVHGARVHSAVRQVLLPPVSKMLEVTLEPAKPKVKPQEKSALKVTVKDAQGKPFAGTAVLAVYDKSLEAITGGSNAGAIHENFWAWKNNYYPRGNADSLPDPVGNLHRAKEEQMQMLGVYGYNMRFNGRGRGFGNGFGGGGMKVSRMAMADGDAYADEAMPAPMTAAAAPMVAKDKAEAGEAPASSGIDAAGNAAPVQVRSEFADLLKWSGSVQTDAEGHAEIPLEFPDNLTTWKARVWTLGKGTQVGEGTAEIITSKELLVRLQAPRFLVERDVSVFSAVVQNDHDTPRTVKVSLELDGNLLEAVDKEPSTVEIAAKGEARVDWRVKALKEGEATIRMRAEAGDDGDAVERKLPIRVHGMLRQDAWSRVVAANAESTHIGIDVPEQRRKDASKLTVRFSPTIAGAVVDAIPYLAEYPYGCTEQTLNRFVPAVVAQRMLKDLKIDLAQVKAKRNNLNPQELGDPAERAAQWKQWKSNPVFDETELEKMVAKGIDRLMTMQNSDRGWGWFSGHGESSFPHTTAVVVHGLLVAKANGAKVPDEMLNGGIGWLMGYERKQVAALQLHVEREALRKEGKKIPDSNRYEKWTCDATDAFVRNVLGEAKRDSEPMLAFLYRDRVDLPVYAKCLLGLELHRKDDEARRDEVMKMISQFMKRDAENQTAYLELKNESYWWWWYGSEVEAHAWYLKLLAAVKPNDNDTRGLVKYLVNNRKHASYWESTRDTAYAIEAIAAYFKASGEDAPNAEVEVLLDGKSLRKVKIDRENLFSFDGSVVLTGEAVATGKHDVEIRRSGTATVYANAYLEVFTLEDKFRAAGLEVKVARHVSKLVELVKENEVPDASGQVVKQNVERFRREPLADGAKLKSGDRIEVELVLESKNDYEYLVFSDAKPAGCEALDALSGYVGGDLGAYMEPRDQTVDFFIRALPRGTRTLRYQLRAESPGVYKALPAVAEAMYAPELRANSEDIRLEITD